MPAHITIAYPFDWPGPVHALVDRLSPALAACPPFKFDLSAPTVWEDEYLFLLVGHGREAVQRLHESIYALALPDVRQPTTFVPHMTIGRSADKTTLLTGVKEASALALPITGTARRLTLYSRDGDERRVRDVDISFGAIA
ncbi:hypothetical protein Ari01nite_98660 [Paractinoplanes rishiriensis]|uniref:2'-5' RNA ligase n=1 Tax=Paractinoplanes rishiriensis TaxID=1050105 RepID=A0A919KDF5_9ACTN|nr:hypothetical protein Ari01nite_98660 [Actinoplanes rishiriensis]